MLDSYILNLDGKCNQRCLFCMKSSEIESGRKIIFTDVIKEIEEARRKGYSHVDFFGGEPTTYSFLAKAIKVAQNKGMSVSLATNAILFGSKKYTVSFFEKIDVDKLNSVRVSLHGKGDVHDRIVQVSGSYDKLIRGMENILRYTERVSVNIVITTLNYESLSELVEILYESGIRAVKFSHINNVGRSRENEWLMINTEKYEDYLKAAIRRARELNFKFIEVVNLDEFWHENRNEFKFLTRDGIY